MIKKEFKVPIYDFRIIYIEIESKEDAKKIEPILQRLRFDEDDMIEIKENIEKKRYNGGHLYRLVKHKLFIVLIYPSSSVNERRKTISHEKRHIEDRILEACLVSDMEAAAYLAGFLSEKIY